MIEKLTAAQQKKVPIYLNKWLRAGLRTKTTNKKEAKKAIHFLYEKILKIEKPKYVIFLDSPMACQLAANLLKGTKLESSQLRSQLYSQLYSQLGSQLYSQLYSQLDSQLYSQLRSQLYSQLYSQLGSQLYSQLRSQLRSQLDSQLGSQLRSQLGSQLRSQLRSQLGSQLGSQLDSQLYSQLYSQLRSQLRSQLGSQLGSQLYSQKLTYYDWCPNLWWWPGWTGFYDFVLNELMPKKKKEFKLFNELTTHWENVHYYLLFPQIVFISDFPKAIRRNDLTMLHDYNKPALEYRDTYALYYSNGITMKPEYITTPADKITKEMFLAEENADQVRELIRKMGMERVTAILQPKVIDTMTTKTGGKYELLSINYDKRGDRPYLKMRCSSSKEVFILGVKPEIKTAKEAWKFLNNGLDLETTNMIWES